MLHVLSRSRHTLLPSNLTWGLQVTSAEIAIEKGEAEVALEAAIPALEEAAVALNDLKKDDITEIRSFAKPHVLVQKAGLSPFWLSLPTLLRCGHLAHILLDRVKQWSRTWYK